MTVKAPLVPVMFAVKLPVTRVCRLAWTPQPVTPSESSISRIASEPRALRRPLGTSSRIEASANQPPAYGSRLVGPLSREANDKGAVMVTVAVPVPSAVRVTGVVTTHSGGFNGPAPKLQASFTSPAKPFFD